MKKITLFLFITFFGFNTFAAKVVASYIGGNITEDQVMDQFKPVLDMQKENKDKKFSELDKNVQELLIRGYVNSKMLEKEADKFKIRESKGFKDKMRGIEMQMIQQELIDRRMKEKMTDQMMKKEIDKEYKKMVSELENEHEVKTSHILVETEQKAKDIKKKISKGTKFSELVKQFSKDETSKVNGGEIGYVTKGQLVPEYEKKAFSMKKGEISDPVKTQFGWHIIKMLDKRKVEIPEKDQAAAMIKNKISREIIEKYFKELTDNAKIELKI